MAKTKDDNTYEGPQGLELKGNLSFARLNPAAGELARKQGQPQLCGWIFGEAYATAEGEGNFGKFTRIIGNFFAVPFHRGTQITATECFLPPVAERFVIAALAKASAGVPIRFEGWAFPDDSGRKGGTGYVYKVFVGSAPGAIVHPGQRMAIDAGIIEAPPAPPPTLLPGGMLPASDEVGAYDRETGEVREDASGLTPLGERHAAE